MTQHEQLISEMERRGGIITTAEILNLTPRIAQYNRVISDLRAREYVIECEESKLSRKVNIFRLVFDPTKKPTQQELFP